MSILFDILKFFMTSYFHSIISNIHSKLKNFHQLPHKTSLIKLGDFSESIDMRAFPEDTVFVKNYKKDPFYEALNLKQWNYQV